MSIKSWWKSLDEPAIWFETRKVLPIAAHAQDVFAWNQAVQNLKAIQKQLPLGEELK